MSYLILKFHNLSLIFTFHMHRDYFMVLHKELNIIIIIIYNMYYTTF